MLLAWGLMLGLLGPPAVGIRDARPVAALGEGAMPRRPVPSSTIASVGYDARTQTLEVEFRSGAVYQYYAVPQPVYEGLMRAKSHGHYLDRYVKKGGYRYLEI